MHAILLLLRYSTQPPEDLPFLLPFHAPPSSSEIALKSGLALLQTVSLYRELLPLIDGCCDAIWKDLFACFTPMSMHAIALLARPERPDAAAHAAATLSLISVWSISYGRALMQRQGSLADDWESGACAELTSTTIALMRSFVSLQECIHAVARCGIDHSSNTNSEPSVFKEHHGDFVLHMLGSIGDIFSFLFEHALAFMPLAAPSVAQEFLLAEIMQEWRASKVGRQGSHEFWDVANKWESDMMDSVKDSMAVQRCDTAQESLLLCVPIFLQHTRTCIQLFQNENTSIINSYAQNMYIMRGMSCPCAAFALPMSEFDMTVPLLMRAATALSGALSEGLVLMDICTKSCVTATTTLVDHRKSALDGTNPAPPFRSQCTLLLAAGSAWSAMIQESGITKCVVSLLHIVNSWLPPPTTYAAKMSPAAATEIANAFEGQKNSVVHALQLLQSGLVQTLQSFNDLECGADASVVAHLEVEMKCLGPTFLGKKSFGDWASVRYPTMENQIFQPQSLKKDAKQCNTEVLLATQAGFVCALHADAVLAPELQLGGIPSICSSDCVVLVSEIHSMSGADGSSATVREQLVLFSDIVERLLRLAAPAAGMFVSVRFSLSLLNRCNDF